MSRFSFSADTSIGIATYRQSIQYSIFNTDGHGLSCKVDSHEGENKDEVHMGGDKIQDDIG